jgi:hypothetical protein
VQPSAQFDFTENRARKINWSDRILGIARILGVQRADLLEGVFFMLSYLIVNSSVDRGIPSLAAGPFDPAILNRRNCSTCCVQETLYFCLSSPSRHGELHASKRSFALCLRRFRRENRTCHYHSSIARGEESFRWCPSALRFFRSLRGTDRKTTSASRRTRPR